MKYGIKNTILIIFFIALYFFIIYLFYLFDLTHLFQGSVIVAIAGFIIIIILRVLALPTTESKTQSVKKELKVRSDILPNPEGGFLVKIWLTNYYDKDLNVTHITCDGLRGSLLLSSIFLKTGETKETEIICSELKTQENKKSTKTLKVLFSFIDNPKKLHKQKIKLRNKD